MKVAWAQSKAILIPSCVPKNNNLHLLLKVENCKYFMFISNWYISVSNIIISLRDKLSKKKYGHSKTLETMETNYICGL
jgi:hypothetical protein